MELMFDNANLDVLAKYAAIYPYVGVTSNPSIIKEEGKIDFFNHFKKIRELIGPNRSLHIQVVSTTAEEIIKEAEKIVSKIDKAVYIKIPVTEEGLKAIRHLKTQGYNITATAIYTRIQGMIAVAAGVDYIAPYFNRIKSRDADAEAIINEIRRDIDRSGAKTKILAASFHYGEQVTKAILAGADAVTLQPELLSEMVNKDYINKAVDKFAQDWQESQGFKNILDCE
jgi:TalC/MipB family fructose-6-phosphate aldolase